jgi:hypothetical protein
MELVENTVGVVQFFEEHWNGFCRIVGIVV